MAKKATPTKVESIRHKDKRANIPTEELRDFVADEELAPKTMLYPRDPSLDPQLVWKGKDEQDCEDLVVPVVPIYIQEKIHPQAIINALPIATHPVTEIAWPLAAQQRNTSQIPDPEQKKTQQQAFQQALNELGRQAATRSLLRDLYSADQLREKMTWFWFNHFNASPQVRHPRNHRRL